MKMIFWTILISVCIILCSCSQTNEDRNNMTTSPVENSTIEDATVETSDNNTTTADTQNSTEEPSTQVPDTTGHIAAPTMPPEPSQEEIESTQQSATEPHTQPAETATAAPDETAVPYAAGSG